MVIRRNHFCLMAVPLVASLVLCPPAPAQVKAGDSKPTAKMSDKAAYKEALALQQAGRLEEALAFLKHAILKKKKPEYETALAAVNNQIADRSASLAEKALKEMDFKKYQSDIADAKKYATTDAVKRLEAEYGRTTGALRQKYEAALKQAELGDPEGALEELKTLTRHDYILPKVASDITRVHAQWIDKLIAEGNDLIRGQRWEDASMRFQKVLVMAPDNAAAKKGQAKTDLGHKSSVLSANAKSQLSSKNYSAAFSSINQAIETYPDSKEEFDAVKRKVTEEWIKTLLEEAPPLLGMREDFEKMRDGYLKLLQVQALDPGHAEAGKLLGAMKEDFAAVSRERAANRAQIGAQYEYSGLATLLMMNAKELGAENLVPADELKKIVENFNRKRVCHLVTSVDNLAAADAKFVQAISDRARSIVENLEMPDIRMHAKGEYDPEKQGDLLLQDMRPDGKSQTVTLTIGVKDWLSVRNSSESPVDVESEFVSGKISKPNPEYAKLKERLTEMDRAMSTQADELRKKGKTREGYSARSYELLKEELNRTSPEIQVDKISPYSYQKRSHKQRTMVRLTAIVRDGGSKKLISSDEVLFQDERAAEEISGAKETDTKGIRNRPVMLTDVEAVRNQGEREVMAGLDKKVPVLLRPYTDRFLMEAEAKLKAGKEEDALEMFICHWASYQGKIQDPGLSERIVQAVKAKTGFDLMRQGESLLKLLLSVPVTTAINP